MVMLAGIFGLATTRHVAPVLGVDIDAVPRFLLRGEFLVQSRAVGFEFLPAFVEDLLVSALILRDLIA